MKITNYIALPAVLLTAGLVAWTSSTFAQSVQGTDWNEQYRSSYEVPRGTYTGRSPYMQGAAIERAPAPVAKPAPRPEPPPPVAAPKTGCSDPTWGLIRMTKTMPPEAGLGSEFVAQLTLTAQACAARIVVRDSIPAGTSYVRSEPAAQREGDELVWSFPTMEAGDTKTIKVWLKADREGTIVNCASVHAEPRTCAATRVGKPVLAIEKSGPATALLGADVAYNIVVKNTGTSVAKNVVLTDPVPEGMGGQPVTINLGDLGPGQTKPATVTFKATKRGRFCNVATATSSNADKVSAEACTLVQQPGLKVEKTGTKEQILGRNADYQIVVSNTGDTTLNNVVVTDTAPAATTIVAAPGAQIAGNKATWTIPSLAAGAKETFSLKLTSKTAGNHCNGVTAAAGTLSDSAQACTLWKGIAAVLLEVVDDPDPIQVGETTTYTIKVTNQGFADIHSVKIVYTSDEETTPVSSPQGTVSGKSVTFPVVATLAPKQVVTYSIVVRGVKVGDSRNKVVLTCDELTAGSVEETESTTVY